MCYQKCANIFPKCVSLVSTNAVLEHIEFGNVDNQVLYEKIMSEAFPKVVNIPYFSCDEGPLFFVCSPDEGKAKSILSAD